MEYIINHNIEDIVYIKTDDEQQRHMVTGVIIRKDGVRFELSRNGYSCEVFDYEITEKENTVVRLGLTKEHL